MLPTKKWATTYRNPLKLIVGVDLLKQKAVEAKEFIWKGTTWFKTQAEESYPKEKNKVAPWDAPTPLPSPRSFLLPEEILDEPLSEKPKK